MLRRTILLCLSLCLLGGTTQARAANDTSAASGNAILLDQGWSRDERLQFYFTPQGSQLVPYDWFLALEQPDNTELLRSDTNMERLRFIPHAKDPQLNPDGLPIGFVKDRDVVPVDGFGETPSLAGGKDVPSATVWVGLTCAACHTTELHHQGKAVRIDGGPTLADAEQFFKQLATSMEVTAGDPAKMTRFAKRVLNETQYNATEEKALQERLAAYAKLMRQRVQRSSGTNPYGYARLDAFGAILNEVCEHALQLPENHVPADAPVSYPFLWDTPRLDWVQWNGSVGNPMGRNVGEVLGVFGQLRLLPDPPDDQFRSSARIDRLYDLEQHVAKLKAPAWPEEFGKIDPAKAAAGKKLYAANCVACHSVPDPATGKYPSVTIEGREYIKTRMDAVGTDPRMIENFIKPAKPGALAGLLPPPLAAAPAVPRPLLLKIAVGGVIERYVKSNNISKEQVAEFNGHRPAGEQPPNPLGYKARPLDGIWATAPYLHNGSVPNLYELLKPAKERSTSFFVGSREYDTKHVGFVTTASAGSFEFKVANEQGPIVGNSNAGHEGHGNGPSLGFTETFDNGKWRPFTDDERWALVEYMKTLGTVQVEQVPPEEAAQIDDVVAATFQQLKNRYPDQKPVLRGVHAKDHGCVKAVVEVDPNLAPDYQVGVFREPGHRYDAWIRYSNAATLVTPDDPQDKNGKPVPGSRGMAIKLIGVEGTPLLPPHGSQTQDFLLVNHPVFAFANVEDYQVLSDVIADPANREQADKFFAIQIGKGGAAAERAKATLAIIGRIRAPSVAAGAYQPQPASPVDPRYFSGAPFEFGDGWVMKYSVTPVAPPTSAAPDVAQPNYLRSALISRLAPGNGAQPIVLKFQVQRRPVAGLDLARDIENASTEWPESEFPFVTVATITIPPQEFDSPSGRAACEDLVFSPWHSVREFRPLGGINRMRRAVYEASASFRHLPKEPDAL